MKEEIAVFTDLAVMAIDAMAVLIIVPALVLTFIVQKHLIAGLTFGGVKG